MNDLTEEVRRLSEAQLREELTPDEAARLEALVCGNPVALQQYVTYLQDSFELHELAGYLRAFEREDNASRTPEKTADAPAAKRNSPRSPLLGFLDRLPAAIHPVQHPISFLTTAVMLTSVFWVVLALIVWPLGERGKPQLETPAENFIARVLHVQAVAWAEGQRPLQPGMTLALGQRVSLERGNVQLLFGNGARVVMEGPAVLQVDGRERMTLDGGRILTRAEEKAAGFTVETPTVRIVDLGTEFGVEVRERETEVQVFTGKVEVLRADDTRDRRRLLSAHEAAAFGNSPQQGFYVQEKKMNRAIYLSLAAVLSLPAASAEANLIVNGSFESPGQAAGGFGGYTSGNQFDATNWPLSGNGGMVLINGAFSTVASDGDQWLSLQQQGGPPNVASITQTVSTPVGFNYELSFDYAVLMHDSQTEWSFSYTVNGTTVTKNLTTGTDILELTPWTTETHTFTPTSPTTTITFTGNQPVTGFFGAAIDNVILLNVGEVPLPAPEPATGAALGLGGMLVLGLARRQRGKK